MKPIILLIISGIFLPFVTKAQTNQAKIDTLLLELAQETADTERIEIMGVIASRYRSVNLDSAEQYGNQGLDLAQKVNYTTGKIKLSYILGVISRMQGDSEKALIYGKKSLSFAAENEDWYWVGSNGNSLGNTYSNLGKYDTAAIYFLKALDAYEKAELPVKTAMIYNNLGDSFYDQNKNKLAEEYFQKALKIYKQNDKLKEAAMVLMNLGKTQSSDSLAMDFLNQALEIHIQNEDKPGIASVNMNIGSKLIRSEKYEAALPYYQEGLLIATQVGHKRKMGTANSSLGKIYSILNQPQKAIQHYEAALELTQQTQSKKEQMETFNNLAQLYKNQNDFKKAFSYLQTSKDLSDTLFSEANLSLASELEAKYDAKQKEATLASQKLVIEQQKNARNRLLIGGVLLLLAITAIFQRYFYHQKRKKQEALLALEKQKSESESLRQLDQLKTKFFANISHELRTPLTMIISPLEEAIKNQSKKSKNEDLSLAHDNSKKLLKLVNEILDLSKLEAGQLELSETTVSLNQLVRRIFYSFQSLAQVRNVDLDLKYKLDQDLGVRLDIEKLEKILNNLLSNAIKFSNSGGLVQLIVDQTPLANGEQLIFKISDSGAGIPNEDLDKVFNRFYQSQTGKTAGGTGIGLALSKELAELFGGKLSVESEVGKGSVFTLAIPLNREKISVPAAEELNGGAILSTIETEHPENKNIYQPILLNGKKPRILVVEDNLDLSGFLIKILSPHYDCQPVFNGKEALQKMAEESFDLITSDVMMPEMDGFEFRKTMSKNPQWRQTPFIMLTARTLEEDKLQGFNLGVDDYITKPFSSPELLARIDNLLKNKSERDLFQKENQEPETPESADHQLLKRAEKIVLDHLSDSAFKVTNLAKEIGYSQRQLARIINRLTGLSTVNFILEIRLQKAYQLFQNRQFATVSEVRYEIGIESAAYFTNKFKERFGKTPKEYLN